MIVFEFIGPFLIAQAVLLDRLEGAANGAVLRPRRGDYAVFGTALGLLGIPLCGWTLLLAWARGDTPMMALGFGALVVAAWWRAHQRDRKREPHADDLHAHAHHVLDEKAGRVSAARLAEPGRVGGVWWPAGSVLRFDRVGWLKEATPSESIPLAGFPLAPGVPVQFDETGRVCELVVDTEVVAGRLPRDPGEARGAELVARAGTAFDPVQLRNVVLAHDTVIRGVEVPAGSTVSLFHGVRVELAAETDVFGQRIEKGARLRFGESGGVLSMLRPQPAVRVSLAAEDGYRTGGKRRTIAVYRDGRVA